MHCSNWEVNCSQLAFAIAENVLKFSLLFKCFYLYLHTLLDKFYLFVIAHIYRVKTKIFSLRRIKLLLQTQFDNPQINRNNQYKGPIDCYKRVVNEHGFFSLWRGNLATVIRYFPNQAINFSTKDFFKSSLTSRVHPKSVRFRRYYIFLSN